MKKFIILMIISFNLLGFKTFSEEERLNKNEKYNAVEFCIGGGVSHGCYLMTYYNKYIDHSNMVNEIEETAFASLSQIIFLNIPFNFTYFINSKFGIGINYTINFGMLFYGGIYPLQLLFLKNQFRLTHKIGKINNRKTLLIEYGFVLDIIIPFDMDSGTSINSLNSYLMGPSFFIGYEFYRKKYKVFTIGGFIDATFQYEKNKENFYEEYEVWNIDLTIGVEFRYRFGFFKQL